MKKGFTLFELLVSISIIAIITALVSISYSNAQKRARDTKIIEDLNLIQKAAEQYYAANGFKYPLTWGTGTKWTDASGTQTILYAMPTDPKGVAYHSAYIDGTQYCLCGNSALEATKGNADDQACSNMGDVNGTFYCVRNQQ